MSQQTSPLPSPPHGDVQMDAYVDALLGMSLDPAPAAEQPADAPAPFAQPEPAAEAEHEDATAEVAGEAASPDTDMTLTRDLQAATDAAIAALPDAIETGAMPESGVTAQSAPEVAPEVVADAVTDAAPVQPARPAFSVPDNLDDLDFDALLDSLHGEGGIPGAVPTIAPTPAPTPVAEPVAAPAPAPPILPASWQAPAEPAEELPPATPAPAGQRWLRVAVGEDRYAVELLRVQEVVRLAPMIAVRGATPSLLGVMNLRGRVVPVHDLGRWLRRSPVEADERSRIVVLEHQDELVGMLVTAVTDVATLDAPQIEPPTPGLRDRIGMGIARTPGAPPTVLLDARLVFE